MTRRTECRGSRPPGLRGSSTPRARASDAAQEQGLSGHEGAFLSEIEIDHVGHILEGPQAWDRLARQEAIDLVSWHGSDQIRFDGHRSHGVHGDAKPCELPGQTLRQRYDSRLGRDVDGSALA